MRTHQVGALVMVDAAQAVPHKQINVSRLNVDFMVFSGHKTLGPSGMGVLYGKRELLEKMDGFMVGGDTVEYTTYTDFKLLPAPEKFEAGLQNYAGIMGMGVACDYLSAIGMRAISDHVKELNQLVTEGLASMKRVRIIGPEDARLRGGISSFYVDGVDPHEISLLLDKSYGILVRSGQHCVHSWFDDRGIPGSVRASMYLYNTREEAARFVAAVEKVLDIL
jgi:cysteine desulfurase/selenocysteine lyase